MGSMCMCVITSVIIPVAVSVVNNCVNTVIIHYVAQMGPRE